MTTPGLTLAEKVGGWVLDYGYVAAWLVRGAVATSRPEDLLTPPVAEPRSPVLMVPGV